MVLELLCILNSGVLLTSCVGLEQQGISNQRIRPLELGNGLHGEPFVQVLAEHPVGEAGERGDEDAGSQQRQGEAPR